MPKTFLLLLLLFFASLCGAQDSSYTKYKDFLMGRVIPSTTPFFTYFQENQRSFYLLKEVYTAYKQMQKAAKADTVNLVLVSAGRNFNYQKSIWERKFDRCIIDTSDTLYCVKELLKYSAMPGTSRHHWGTEIDINAVNFAYYESNEGKKVYDWLQANAGNFGFCQVYDPSAFSHRTGYNEEPWHWSYLPLASKYLNDYNQNIDHQDFYGFSGAQYGDTLSIKQYFVNGIGFICK